MSNDTPQTLLSADGVERLWSRFHQVIRGFTDFQNPGAAFVDNETGYKRAVLKKFQQELGAEKLSALVAQGQGLKAAKEIIRVLTSNLVSFHAWNATLGETDQAACDVLLEYLKATSAPYQGPETTSGLFDAYARHGLRPNWDALSVLLWALRPNDFFPVKIRYYRRLGAQLGYELPSGRPDADKLHSLIEFGRAFWKALEPQKPADWVDVQSFIWCVCPDTYGQEDPESSSPPKGWKFTKWMGPVLDALRALGGSGTPQAVLQKIQELVTLPDSVLTEKLGSGQTRLYNEVAWARKYLVWEGLVESPERGTWALTAKGKSANLDDQQAQIIAERWADLHKQEAEDRPEVDMAAVQRESTEDIGDAQGTPPSRSSPGESLADPFRAIFESRHEAQLAFDLLRSTLLALGVKPEACESDTRIALTLPMPQDPPKMRLNFGKWAIIAFYGPGKGADRLEFLCQKDLLPISRAKPPESQFVDLIDDNAFTLVCVPPEQMLAEQGPERKAFEASLAQAARQFAHWNASTWRNAHRPELLRMVFDKDERERLLSQGLADTPAPPKHQSSATQYWWLNANPKIWNFEATSVGEKQTYTSHNEKGNKRQKYRYFQEVNPGDMVIGYVTSPQKEVVAVCKITKGLHQTENGEEIEFEKIEQLPTPIAYESLQANPDLAKSEPLINNQGSLFRLTEQEYDIIRDLIDGIAIPLTTEIESYDKKKAMAGLFLEEAQFDEMLEALKEKKNVVLQGAPGVGKTYVARRLAYAFIGSNDPQRIEVIQFHQSYSYEDFIQGFRPTPKGQFALKSGIFHQFCRRAQREEAQGKPYVFIIDEINRGNLSKIFGELMMLIEPDKRGKEHAIPLTYSEDADEKFYIPENLHLIGMMNTADRSLAMVDYALRRRFRFITLRPEFLSEVFQGFLANAGAEPELVKKIIARMTALNEVIAADTKNLGLGYQIGHSYFCPRNGITPDDDWYRRVIESEIVPLIQEYWFDNEQKVKEQRSALLA